MVYYIIIIIIIVITEVDYVYAVILTKSSIVAQPPADQVSGKVDQKYSDDRHSQVQ